MPAARNEQKSFVTGSANAVSLGAANFAGYLAGALLARRIAAALSSRQALRLLMFVATAAFFACAYPVSLVWFFAWRFASGLSGGVIMVLVPTPCLNRLGSTSIIRYAGPIVKLRVPVALS